MTQEKLPHRKELCLQSEPMVRKNHGFFWCRKIINVKKRGICYTIIDIRSCTGIINGRETGYYDGKLSGTV